MNDVSAGHTRRRHHLLFKTNRIQHGGALKGLNGRQQLMVEVMNEKAKARNLSELGDEQRNVGKENGNCPGRTLKGAAVAVGQGKVQVPL